MKLWAMIYRGDKKLKEHVAKKETGGSDKDLGDCLEEICYVFDLPKPVLLSHHERQLHEFGRVRFYPRDFMEPVSFTRMELEVMDEEKKKKAAEPAIE
ncbi:MAG: hypothetical protein ACYCX2_00965 [Christensenellales bacterium]